MSSLAKFIILMCLLLACDPALAEPPAITYNPMEGMTEESDPPSYTIHIIEDSNARNKSFSEQAKRIGITMELTGCKLLIDVPVGTAHGNHSYGGFCKLRSGDKEIDVEICSDDMVGHFEVKYGPVLMNKKSLADFVVTNCMGG